MTGTLVGYIQHAGGPGMAVTYSDGAGGIDMGVYAQVVPDMVIVQVGDTAYALTLTLSGDSRQAVDDGLIEEISVDDSQLVASGPTAADVLTVLEETLELTAPTTR